jgi:hypothetical protein
MIVVNCAPAGRGPLNPRSVVENTVATGGKFEEQISPAHKESDSTKNSEYPL